MAHQTGVVRNASQLKGKFSQIVAEASNKEKCIPKNPTRQTERTET